MFQFLTPVELSRSMAAIFEIPQYMAYQKNVAYDFIKLSTQFHNFNILYTTDVLSCPTIGFLRTKQEELIIIMVSYFAPKMSLKVTTLYYSKALNLPVIHIIPIQNHTLLGMLHF